MDDYKFFSIGLTDQELKIYYNNKEIYMKLLLGDLIYIIFYEKPIYFKNFPLKIDI